jgi:hypothetical protein
VARQRSLRLFSQNALSLSTINGSFVSPLSGNIQFGASSCFSSGPLATSSAVCGDVVELDIAMADGLMLSGRGSVSDPATAKALTFSYIINSLENPFMCIAACPQRGEQFRDVIRSSGFHRDVNSGVAQIHAVVRPVVRSFHNVSPVLGQDSGEVV